MLARFRRFIASGKRFGCSCPQHLAHSTSHVQVVSHWSLLRTSPIHDQAFLALAALDAPRHARLATWFPYPQMGVAELDPPSGSALCTPASWVGQQTAPITLTCGLCGGTITAITFASYGTPTGNCPDYAIGSCHAANSSAVVSQLCVGANSCVIDPVADFGDPCYGTVKHLAVVASCSNASAGHTYYNFTVLDSFVGDFWGAVVGDASAPILSLSTAPTWLYSPDSYAYPQNASVWDYGYEQGKAPVANLSALGDYYGRVMSWYMLGSFADEYGQPHVSAAAPLNVSLVEIYNEVDYEHGHTPQSYTLEYDAIVDGIRRWADPTHQLRFVGLSLPNIDDTPTVVTWATYFLNASNHQGSTPAALDYIGYHAYPTYGNFTPDPNSFTGASHCVHGGQRRPRHRPRSHAPSIPQACSRMWTLS